jgi:membrane protein
MLFLDQLYKKLWQIDEQKHHPAIRLIIKIIRIFFAVLRDLRDGELNLRAASLVYVTLLSLVPLLAVSFSVLKAFGVHNAIAPLLLVLFDPLGIKAQEIVTRIIDFVDRVNVGVLGTVGLLLLVFTVISLMQKIEAALNYTWHVTQNRLFVRRFAEYLSLLLVGPLFIMAATALKTAATHAPFWQEITGLPMINQGFQLMGLVLPYVLYTITFTLIYIFLPNTRVRFVPALVGGAVTTILWTILGYAFRVLVVETSSYDAIYSTFATVLMSMIWLYVGWLMLLIGASVAYYIQYPRHQELSCRFVDLSNRLRERLAVMIILHLAKDAYGHNRGVDADDLAQAFNLSLRALNRILKDLKIAGLLSEIAEPKPRLLVLKPFDQLSVADVLLAIRQAEEAETIALHQVKADDAIHRLFENFDAVLKGHFAKVTFKDMVMGVKNA